MISLLDQTQNHCSCAPCTPSISTVMPSRQVFSKNFCNRCMLGVTHYWSPSRIDPDGLKTLSPGTALSSSPQGQISRRSTAGWCRSHRGHNQRLQVSCLFFHQVQITYLSCWGGCDIWTWEPSYIDTSARWIPRCTWASLLMSIERGGKYRK